MASLRSFRNLFARKPIRRRLKIGRSMCVPAETLEGRQLLSADLYLLGGTLHIDGSSANDTAIVLAMDGRIGTAVTDGETVTANWYADSQVRDIVFLGFEGDDTFINLTGIAVRAEGHAGNDSFLTAGAADTLLGGSGHDRFVDLYGNDTIAGGADNDRAVSPSREDETTFNDADGSATSTEPTILLSHGLLGIVGTNSSDRALVLEANRNVYVVMTDGSNVWNETFDADEVNYLVFRGYEGNDRLINVSDITTLAAGDAGNDILIGGTGRNVLLGGSDNDLIVTRSDSDTVRGGAGDDLMMTLSTDDSQLDSPDRIALDGRWQYAGLATSIRQSGGALEFVNERGVPPAGRRLDASRVEATGWGNLIGTINGTRIEWSNGTVWEKVPAIPEIAGDYGIQGLTTHVEQDGGSLTFINEFGNRAEGRFVTATEFVADGWGGLRGTWTGERIEWANGTVWEVAMPTLGTSLADRTIRQEFLYNGGRPEVRVDGLGDDLRPLSLTFINEHGNSSRGRVVEPGTVEAIDWQLRGEVDDLTGEIRWANGSVWQATSELELSINGRPTRVRRDGWKITVINENGSESWVLVNGNRLTASDWAGLSASVTADQIRWDNGTVWQLPPQGTGTVQTDLVAFFAGTPIGGGGWTYSGTLDQNLNAIGGNPLLLNADFYSPGADSTGNELGQNTAQTNISPDLLAQLHTPFEQSGYTQQYFGGILGTGQQPGATSTGDVFGSGYGSYGQSSLAGFINDIVANDQQLAAMSTGLNGGVFGSGYGSYGQSSLGGFISGILGNDQQLAAMSLGLTGGGFGPGYGMNGQSSLAGFINGIVGIDLQLTNLGLRLFP